MILESKMDQTKNAKTSGVVSLAKRGALVENYAFVAQYNLN